LFTSCQKKLTNKRKFCLLGVETIVEMSSSVLITSKNKKRKEETVR
jgi:hypothetical protein